MVREPRGEQNLNRAEGAHQSGSQASSLRPDRPLIIAGGGSGLAKEGTHSHTDTADYPLQPAAPVLLQERLIHAGWDLIAFYLPREN